MKLRYLFFLSLLFSLFLQTVSAQQRLKFSVVDFHQDQLDLTARNEQFKRTDDSGSLYAIIKVKADVENDDLQDFLFDFGYMNSFVVMHDDLNELWVYVQKNAKTVTIRRDGYLTLNKYDLRTTIEAGCTYVMRLQVAAPTVYTQMVMFRVKPLMAKAMVMVKGEGSGMAEDVFGMVDETGAVAKALVFGSYTYRVVAENFYPTEGRFTLNNQTETHIEEVTMRGNFGTITLQVESDADIYVDGNMMGLRSWTGALKAGNHQVECRQVNHRSISQNIDVAENESRTITLTPPTPITGILSITSRPLGANIRIDGQDYGQTPKNITGLLIGKHTVELVADGRKGGKQEFEIKEDEATAIDMELAENFVSSAGEQTFSVTGHGQTVSFKMVLVEGGTFMMGATSEQGHDAWSSEKPKHSVTLTNDYYIGETEVTQALWKAVMGRNPSHFKGPDRPVEQVSWDDCQAFIRKLNSLTGKNFRLPTEAEWEFAARGGTKSQGFKYSGSNSLGTVACYADNNTRETSLVKTKSPNELGIYDMSGNVWEWCEDWFGSYSYSSQTNPTGASSSSARVHRGGAWDSIAKGCRVSTRPYNTPTYKSSDIGLRLALSPIF